MNRQTRPARRTRSYRAFAACLGTAGVVAAAGCSVAAGAATDNAAVGPVRVGRATQNFAPFPVPAVWAGLHNKVYQEILKPKNGTAKRNFRVIARSEMVFWLNCIGAGNATLSSPATGLKWSLPCGSGNDPQGVTVTPPAAAVGHGANVLVTVAAGARWEVRIDGIAPSGVDPEPASIPTHSANT
jgi:hypothetical protein